MPSTDHIAPVTYLFGSSTDADSMGGRNSGSEVENSVLDVVEGNTRASGRFQPINNASMSALSRRAMSEQEMFSYLAGRDFDEAEIEVECDRLRSVGLLDDVSFAVTVATALRDRKGLGRTAISAELRRRRVDPTAIEKAFDSIDGGGGADEELERATSVAVKRAPQLHGLDSQTARRRLGAFLMRKGYSGSIVSAAVKAALEPTTPSGPTFR